MKKLKNALFQLVVAVFLAGSLSSCGYNSMVNKEEAVTSQWAQVENVYQRRLDLIPNLVKTVEGATNFEKSTLKEVIEARSRATSMQIDPSKLTPENIQRFEQTQNQLSGALSRLLVTVEQYPQLKANQNFLELQSQLEGTENRIAVERNKFNTVVQDYNSYIRRFPNNLFAGLFGFEKKGYFQAPPPPPPKPPNPPPPPPPKPPPPKPPPPKPPPKNGPIPPLKLPQLLRLFLPPLLRIIFMMMMKRITRNIICPVEMPLDFFFSGAT